MAVPIEETSVEGVDTAGSGPRLIALLLGISAAGVVLFLAIRQVGMRLPGPAAAAAGHPFASPVSVGPNVFQRLLLALAIIIVASRLAASLFRRLHQPPVIGEVLAGILLGPSLLGAVWPEAREFLFPTFVLPALGIVSQLGIALFMFLVGLELNTDRIRTQRDTALAVSFTSIVCPFLMGSSLALYLYPSLSASNSFTGFALFMGVSMSVTAFPVLARILSDRQIDKSPLGSLALTCAAAGDAAAWCLLAFVVGVVNAQVGRAAITIGLTAAYIAFMLAVVRPVINRLVHNMERTKSRDQQLMALIFVSFLLSCVATEAIGIHALFGAFLLGAIVPHDSWVAETIVDKLHDFVVMMLLPAFFALTGLRTQIGLIQGSQWLIAGLIILIAFAGKYGGSTAAARFAGLPWRDSHAIGILMNTRGLMELIVLNVGLDLRVISPTLFAMLVIMAVVTTFATSPILDTILNGHKSATTPRPGNT